MHICTSCFFGFDDFEAVDKWGCFMYSVSVQSFYTYWEIRPGLGECCLQNYKQHWIGKGNSLMGLCELE